VDDSFIVVMKTFIVAMRVFIVAMRVFIGAMRVFIVAMSVFIVAMSAFIVAMRVFIVAMSAFFVVMSAFFVVRKAFIAVMKTRTEVIGAARARFAFRPYLKFPAPVRNAPATPALGHVNVSVTSDPSTPVDRIWNVPTPNPLASVSVPSVPRVSAVHVAWFALSTSTVASGTRALRTQRLVQYSLDSVWNSYIIGPVSGHSASSHDMLRGSSLSLSALYASVLVSMLLVVVSPYVTTRRSADLPFAVVT